MASNSPKKIKSCSCKLEDDGGRCSHCDRSFENIHQFVRHVTHSKECKANYEPSLIQDFKTIARQATKRKWYHDQAHGPNGDRFKAMRKKNRKTVHVPNSVKWSASGLAFTRLFKPIYQKCLDEAKLMIEKQANDQNFLTEKAFDEALDKTFSDDTLQYIFVLMSSDETLSQTVDEDLILSTVFERLEKCFDNVWSKKCKVHRDDWSDFQFNEVCANLFQIAQNKVFQECFEEFKFKSVTYSQAIDNTLDEIFLKLTTTEGYFDDEKDLERQMSTVFDSILIQETKKLFDVQDDLQQALANTVEGILKKRFAKNGLNYSKVE